MKRSGYECESLCSSNSWCHAIAQLKVTMWNDNDDDDDIDKVPWLINCIYSVFFVHM